MLYGPCVRDGVWTGGDESLSREEIERLVNQRARSIVSDMLEERRIKSLFPSIGSLEKIWSTDEDADEDADEDWED